MIHSVAKQDMNTVVRETKLPFEGGWKSGWLEYRNIARLYILNACAMGLLYLAIQAPRTWLRTYILSALTSLASAEISLLLLRSGWVRVVIANVAIKPKDQIPERERKYFQFRHTFRLEAFLLVPVSVGFCFLVIRPFLADFLSVKNLIDQSREYLFAFDGIIGLLSYILLATVRKLITRSALTTLSEFERVVSINNTSRAQLDPRTDVSL